MPSPRRIRDHAPGGLLAAFALASGSACGGPTLRAAPLGAAGSERDDGAGLLGRASVRLTSGGFDTGPDVPAPISLDRDASFGGAAYGGAAYGGAAYGGPAPSPWVTPPAMRPPKYYVTEDLRGTIEGVVTWTGPRPARLATRCGSIDDPGVRVGADGGAGGVIVYISQIAIGRPRPMLARTATVGGDVVKHGCGLYPAAQVLSPAPAGIAVHGDAGPAKVRVTLPVGDATEYPLQAGGLLSIDGDSGVTRVDTADGSLSAAWVVGVETPYFAMTDDRGRFRIDELGPGRYDVTFWQAPLAHVGADGALAYGEPVVVHRTVAVDLGKPAVVRVALPALPAP